MNRVTSRAELPLVSQLQGPSPLGVIALLLQITLGPDLFPPRAFALPAGCAWPGHREPIQSLTMVTHVDR